MMGWDGSVAQVVLNPGFFRKACKMPHRWDGMEVMFGVWSVQIGSGGEDAMHGHQKRWV